MLKQGHTCACRRLEDEVVGHGSLAGPLSAQLRQVDAISRRHEATLHGEGWAAGNLNVHLGRKAVVGDSANGDKVASSTGILVQDAADGYVWLGALHVDAVQQSFLVRVEDFDDLAAVAVKVQRSIHGDVILELMRLSETTFYFPLGIHYPVIRREGRRRQCDRRVLI